MNNPAMLTDATRERGEHLMARATDLQARARQITRMMGRAETIYRRTADTFRHGAERAAVAAEIREARRWLRDAGYDAAVVCAEFRDPGAHAFCCHGSTESPASV